MANNGQQWPTMGNNGQQWTTMDNDGQQWVTMGNNRYHWATMDNIGQQWTTIRGVTCISDAVCQTTSITITTTWMVIHHKFIKLIIKSVIMINIMIINITMRLVTGVNLQPPPANLLLPICQPHYCRSTDCALSSLSSSRMHSLKKNGIIRAFFLGGTFRKCMVCMV